jgi:membrane associated rhomboid family serine protease
MESRSVIGRADASQLLDDERSARTMGFSNRDYMQDGGETSGPSWGHDVPTTKWLLIVTVAVFFLQTLLTHTVQRNNSETIAKVDRGAITAVALGAQDVAMQFPGWQVSYIEEWCLLDASKVIHGQIWRLVTYVFCHARGSPLGLVFNMIGLWYLGSVLERMYGSRELLCFYLASALFCGLIFVAFGLKLVLPSPLFGATSCIVAMLTVYATYFPRQQILFFWVIPVQVQVLLGIYVGLDVYGVLLASSRQAPWTTVAYLSSIWAVGFGYLYRRLNWRLSNIADVLDIRNVQRSIRRATTARRLKVFSPEPVSNLEEQVDAILAKIHEQGSESLTDRERSILQRASEQAKNRS